MTFTPKESPKNWTEDFSHENGLYMNLCITCKELFYGHKDRVVCKECHKPVTFDDGSWYEKAEWEAMQRWLYPNKDL